MKKIQGTLSRVILKWRESLIISIAIFIPLAINFGNTAIIISFLSAFWLFIKKPLDCHNPKSFSFLFPVIFFLLILISALTSNNIHAGLKQIDKGLLYVLIAFPLFYLKPSVPDILRRTLIAFSILTLGATIFLIGNGLLKVYMGSSWQVLFFHGFSNIFDQHPVYFALYLSFSVFSLSHYYAVETVEKSIKIVLIASISVLILGLVLTASKAVLIFFLLVFPIQIFFLTSKLKQRFFVLFLILGVFALVFTIPIVKERFSEGLEFNIERFQPTGNLEKAKVFSNEEKVLISDLELRYLFFKIGLYHVLNDQKILFGYGLGDVQSYLDYYYMVYGLAPGWFEGYNLHNQYLQTLVSQGIFSFLYLFLYMIYSFSKAIKARNMLHIYFLSMLAFVFMFECLLSRNKGIVFFIFFNTLFLLYSYRDETRNLRN